MNLNSHIVDGLQQFEAGSVYGGFQQVYGVALSWHLNDWVRLMLQFQRRAPLTAPSWNRFRLDLPMDGS
jgi:hypothetical protein